MVGYSTLTGWNRTYLGYGFIMVVKNTTGVKPFVLQRRDANLTFPEDHEFHGLEIRVKLDVSISTFLEFQTVSETNTAEDMKMMFLKFGNEIVLEWNLHDEQGKPVPPTGDGFLGLPPNICTAMIQSWAENAATAGVA